MTDAQNSPTDYSVGFQPSICPRCTFILLDTDIGATLCPYHPEAVTMEAIAQ